MKHIIVFIALLLFLPSQANNHKYFFSFTEINYNPGNKKLEVAVKVFFDDLQEAILTEQDIEIDDPVEDYSKNIEKFVRTHFSIKNSDGPVKLKWIGVETELDAVWIYLESDTMDFVPNWTIENTMFVDLFPSQNNMINFYPDKAHPKLVKGLALSRQKRKGDIKF